MKLQDIDGITNMVYSKMNTDYPRTYLRGYDKLPRVIFSCALFTIFRSFLLLSFSELEITREYAFGMVVFVAVLGLLGGILIAIGKASYGGAFVALFLALITPIMHNPAKSDNPEIEQIMVSRCCCSIWV